MNDTVSSNAVPLLGDVSLRYVQHIEHALDSGFSQAQIPGLDGSLQQHTGRMSHQIYIRGLLFGGDALDQLKSLQETANDGQEMSFAANIVTALELQKVIVSDFRVLERAERPNCWQYEIALRESPPLPPPAQVESFGGLGDFGLGDLGFDTDIMGDLTDLAADAAGALDNALGVLDALGSLGDLGSAGGLLNPLQEPAADSASVGSDLKDSLGALESGFN